MNPENPVQLADEEGVKDVLVSTVCGLPFANPEDITIPRCVHTADEARPLKP